MTIYRLVVLIMFLLLFSGCKYREKGNQKTSDMKSADSTGLYAWNRQFIQKHTGIIELSSGNSAIILVPAWQGRVMTSTAEGPDGFSFGWINHKLIASGQFQPHINAFGGEERFWIGPEGGQFSVFFPQGSDFTYENWQTPSIIDTEPYEIVKQSEESVLFSKETSLVNYSGFRFELKIDRKVSLLLHERIPQLSGIDLKELNFVAYQSENSITNTGKEEWKKETGLLSVWMLGMLTPSPAAIVIIPVKDGNEKILGPKVNDNYFGKIPQERLKVIGNHIFFKADGKIRGKIGIPPLRTTGVMGSYDSQNSVLNLLFCNLPETETDYVNSEWALQDNPYSGDAFNSYNDGPLEDGSQMGPFYELETSSPAAKLKPGESITHTQITVHLTGNKEKLDKAAEKILGVNLETISKVFK